MRREQTNKQTNINKSCVVLLLPLRCNSVFIFFNTNWTPKSASVAFACAECFFPRPQIPSFPPGRPVPQAVPQYLSLGLLFFPATAVISAGSMMEALLLPPPEPEEEGYIEEEDDDDGL